MKAKGTDDNIKKEDDKYIVTIDNCIIIFDENFINIVSHESSWVIDSGAYFYYAQRENLFSSYISSDFGIMKMGNDRSSPIVGISDILLENNNVSHLILKKVRHIPDVRLNLLFTGKLDDEEYTYKFIDGQ